MSSSRPRNEPRNQDREAAEQWLGQWKLLRRSDRDAVPDTLGPPLVFSNRAASAAERERCGHAVPDHETGPHSRTVTSRLRMSCAGWRTVPTAAEFYEAIHRPSGADRETAILLTWYHGSGHGRATLRTARGGVQLAATRAGAAPGGADGGRRSRKGQSVRRTMTSRKTPETLTTKGQPTDILARIRPAFRKHIRPVTRGTRGESLGGGSILNARWDHRLSRDLDVHLELTTTEDRRAVLDRAAEACGGYRIEHPQFRRIEFERNKENHVDVSFAAPTPRGGEATAIVDGEATTVLSTAQIMSGKLWGRAMHAPARDLVDIAACGRAEPEALEIAVNGLPEKSLDAILAIYDDTQDQYRKDAGQLEGVAEELGPVVANPSAYAKNAILGAKYLRFEIRTHGGAAVIHTATTEGTRLSNLGGRRGAAGGNGGGTVSTRFSKHRNATPRRCSTQRSTHCGRTAPRRSSGSSPPD